MANKLIFQLVSLSFNGLTGGLFILSQAQMHLIILFNIASSLLFTYSNGLATYEGASARAKRDIDGFGNVAVEQSQDFAELPVSHNVDNLELSQMISQHEQTQQQQFQHQKSHLKTPEKHKHTTLQEKMYHHHQSSEDIRGLRCGSVLFSPKNLQDAANRGCTLLKKKKKTIGIRRYPIIYPPSDQELSGISPHKGKPTGPLFIYPILERGSIYKFGRSSGRYRVVFNNNCEVAGATVIRKTMNKCKGLKCYLPFRHKPKVSTVCPLDYQQ